ncbi:hypothetical protein GOP47_0002572 [Adiantum capillus-veneris]|uniref:DUF7795 domain-containing protein n=1 Tax=Adiantum capillus-veneris TaxID=13818 RepID=A0A9D4VAL6_ADICA|nr:hypothetical protein GOP47_0002572 [Adiantum capillus-veneris]
MSELSLFQGLPNVKEAISCFNEFMLRVLQLEEMHRSSSNFVMGYQQELEKLRRAALDESSCLVKDILNSISSSRVASYTEAGCRHVRSDQQTLVKLNGFIKGLKDHIARAQSLVEELEMLVTKVIVLMDAHLESINAKRLLNVNLEEHNEDVKQVLFCEDSNAASWKSSDYAILISSLLSMLKKDLQMQELVVSDLNLNTESECLHTYTQMWALRPFLEEALVQRALGLHK